VKQKVGIKDGCDVDSLLLLSSPAKYCAITVGAVAVVAVAVAVAVAACCCYVGQHYCLILYANTV
jgi:hypothetical protein